MQSAKMCKLAAPHVLPQPGGGGTPYPPIDFNPSTIDSYTTPRPVNSLTQTLISSVIQ